MRIFLLYLIVYTYVLLGAYSYASNLPAGVLKAEQATYKVVVLFGENKDRTEIVLGTGFFIAPDLFVTAFHVIDQIENVEEVFVVRDDKPSIKVKKLVSVSAYADLAILQTEQKSDIYLSEGEKSLFHDGVFAIGYPVDMIKPVTIRSVGEIKIMENVYYAVSFKIPFIGDIRGMSGGPLLDSKGNLLGIFSAAFSSNFGKSVWSSYLQELLDNHIGTVCENQPRKCIDQEIQKVKKLITQQLDSNYLIPKKERTFFHLPIETFERFFVSTDDIVRYLSKGAELNHPNALFTLGVMYHVGKGVEQDSEKAISYYEGAAKMDLSEALFNLGIIYHKGKGVEQDFEKAISYYEGATKMNLSEALFHLGLMYHEGEGVEQDYEKAIYYYERAANMNDPEALFNLGFMYYEGEGVEQDYEKAIFYYEGAAKMDLSEALVNLGLMYREGQGVEQDSEKAISYFKRVADMNDPAALFNLGLMYFRGQGVKQDYEKAISYFKRAANVNHPDALFVLKSLDRQ